MSRAYVLINCELGSEKSLIDELGNLHNVRDAHGTLGMYDIVIKIESDSNESINSTITRKIRKIPCIHSTMTLTGSADNDIFVPDPDKSKTSLTENPSQAYVVIHCDHGQEYEILRKLSHIPEIKEADVVFGFYDVMCKIEAAGIADLEKIITKGIRSLKHVRTTMTLNIILEQ